ncbi:carboxypeptidase regulatory-like domain-containing protein [Peribacillus sp. ACCC06369]|uniref:MSCRAMM family protein n=1 Tax=Peribacillus sp. ACCC06369 TaxID=3055860 RepID=UPI0025A18FD5|nr:carboxypeptidase regulatory-like domain-containing protein [Peribacillus sp. ACCC06369]MDM5356405.1 carboxypeptidase regulatory-like domain-containing protein [Peribacillus sp. ACCC06369]
MAIIEPFSLQPSPLITIDGREEETANFNLQANPTADAGVVLGFVRLPDGTPIPLATVKLFTSNNDPFEHVNSNPAGQFVFPKIPVGSYFITAAEPTLLTPLRIPITVSRNRNTNVTITMQADPEGNRNAIYGIVRSLTDAQPIQGATVQLSRRVGNQLELEGTVNTNAQGQYLFANLVDGDYFIDAVKPGFLSNQSATFNISGREFAPSDIGLAVDPDATTGTISGFVLESSNNFPINNAIVALYSVSNGTESIIEITKTNAGGLYLFGDIPPGTYRVKATVQIEE